MTIYICGKVTGDSNYRQKFRAEEDRIHLSGNIPVNPASFIPTNMAWEKAMRIAIRAMLQCDGVSLLDDWKKSKGAKIEAKLARQLGLDVRPSKDWRF